MKVPWKLSHPPLLARYVIPVVRNTFQIINELAQSGALTLNRSGSAHGNSQVNRVPHTGHALHLGVAVRDPEQKTYRLRRMLGALRGKTVSTESSPADRIAATC